MNPRTILISALIVVCFGNAFAQQSAGQSLRKLQRQGQEVAGRGEHCSAVQGVPGVTTPLIPFDEKAKIKYEDAVERAKKNDPEAFYWLAYYFLKGEGVEENREVAGKFLQKAVDAGDPKACYLVGLHHAYISLVDESGQNGFGGWNKLLPERDCDETATVVCDAKMNYRIGSLQIPSGNGSEDATPSAKLLHSRSLLSRIAEHCFTNDVATGYVLGLYSKAVEGGLSYATNDIVRLNMAIAKCRERIAERTAAENAAKENGALALALLEGEDAGREKVEKEGDSRQSEEWERQQEYWSTWPKHLDDNELALLGADFEQKFDCIFFDSHAQAGSQPSLLRRPGQSTLIPKSVRLSPSTNTWMRGCGKSLFVVGNGGPSMKIDQHGQLVAYGLDVMAEELCWYDAEKLKRLDAKRSKWAEERGMTIEVALRNYEEWLEQNRRARSPALLPLPSTPRLLSSSGMSLRERRAARASAQELESERAAREVEREAQRAQLLQIREELLRARVDRQAQENQ